MARNATSPLVDQFQAGLASKVAELRTVAASALAQLDSRILKKEAEYQKLVRGSVRRDEAAALIARRLRDSIAGHRLAMDRAAGFAIHLNAFKPISFTSWNERVGLTESEREASPPTLLGYPRDPLDVAALCFTDDMIDAYALRVATEAGARIDGPSVEELYAQAQQVLEELRALYAERMHSKEALKGYVEVGPLPEQPPEADDAAVVGLASPTPSPQPSVTRLDAHGQPLDQSFGHSFEELMHLRVVAQRTEERAEASAAGLSEHQFRSMHG